MDMNYGSMVVGGHAVGECKVYAPWDGQCIGSVAMADAEIADRALAVAHEVYENRDAWLSPARRVEIFDKARQIMSSRMEELAVQAAAEGGKPLIDSRVELARAIDGLQSCIECIRTMHGDEIPMGITKSSANRLAMTYREPIGVVLAFSAFNHPMNLIVHQIGPALAAGCPVIVKPASDTPLSCFAFVEILREAGLDDKYCQALLVKTDVAEKIASDPRVGFFSFIGSGKVGWYLRSRLAPGVRCALEHGGVAPVIIAADADLDDTLPLIAKGGFYHAGQVCVSVQRVYAHVSLAERVATELAAQAGKMKIGDPVLPDTDVGPLIRKSEIDRIDQWVNEAVASGAKLICGGKREGETAYMCTVLVDPPDYEKVSCEEIFGPVVCVYSYEDINDAIHRANALPFSFQSAVMTRDMDTAMYCCRRLDAAAVMVNDHTAFRVDWMPFAGHKVSGYGTGGIRYTFEDMQIEKLIVLRSRSL